MVYHSIAEIFDALEQTRGRLMSSVEGLGEGQERFRPAPERWSVADIVEHLSMAEASSVKLFERLLQKAEEGPARADSDPFAPVSIAEQEESRRGEKFQSPERILPTGRAALADSLDGLRAALDAIRALRPRMERVDGAAVHFPHPAYGPLNLYQWLLFTAAHEERHRVQIEELKREMRG